MSGSTELSHFRSDRGSAIVVHLGEDHLDSCPLGCTGLHLKILTFETLTHIFLARYIHQHSFVWLHLMIYYLAVEKIQAT